MPTDYTPIAATFDRRYRDNDYTGVERTVLTFLRGAAAPVLEVGCGTGHWLALASAQGIGVAGVDASEAMLRQAAERLPMAELMFGRAESLPFADGGFDRVFCVNALHHFDDATAFFGEARRVLRPGGAVLTIGLDPHTGLDRWCIYDYFEGTRERDLRRYASTESIRGWIRDAGFTDRESFIAQHMPSEFPASLALAKGRLDKSTTSQLAELDEDAYLRGIAAIRAAMESATARGEDLSIGADLRLWATTARVPVEHAPRRTP